MLVQHAVKENVMIIISYLAKKKKNKYIFTHLGRKKLEQSTARVNSCHASWRCIIFLPWCVYTIFHHTLAENIPFAFLNTAMDRCLLHIVLFSISAGIGPIFAWKMDFWPGYMVINSKQHGDKEGHPRAHVLRMLWTGQLLLYRPSCVIY